MREAILKEIENWADSGEMFNYISSYGEVFTIVSNHGKVEDIHECKHQCKSKNRFAFELNDLDNYAYRLNQTNFLIEIEIERTSAGNLLFGSVMVPEIVI